MVKKRASLKDRGEEILGIRRGGKGTDILFGAGGETERAAESETSESEYEEAPPQEEGMPQGEADLDETLGAEAEAAAEETGAEYPAAEEGMPESEADLDEALDLDSLLGAEAEAAEGEADLPVLATTPAAPSPEPTTPPPAMERPLPAPIPAPSPVAEPAVEPAAAPPPVMERPLPAPMPVPSPLAEPVIEPAAAPPPGVERPEPAPPPPTAQAEPAPTVGQPSVASPSPPPAVRPSPPPPTPAVAPPSTDSGAPDLSVPRPPRYIQMVSDDFDLLDEEPSADAVAAEEVGLPEAVELTNEVREELLRRRVVQEDLANLDRAIDAQYDRILRDNVSVNKWITDWCHNLLAEARTIVLHQQVESLPKAEWNVQQVRARLDRAEESSRKALRYAWPITIWGILWFALFVYLIFDPTLPFRFLPIPESGDTFLVPEIFLRTLYFGGIGAVAAVFYHLFKYVQERSFDSQFGLSYVAKPFMGMIMGSMIYLTVFVVTRAMRIAPAGLATGDVETVTDLMYVALLYFIAMAAGFKENLAFDLLNQVIRSLLGDSQKEKEAAPPPPTTTTTEAGS